MTSPLGHKKLVQAMSKDDLIEAINRAFDIGGDKQLTLQVPFDDTDWLDVDNVHDIPDGVTKLRFITCTI